jgi:hypothetical protein
MSGAAVFFWLVVIAVDGVMLLLFRRRQAKLGNVRCRRCYDAGLAKGKWAPVQGRRPVCSPCESGDWVRV